MPFSLLKLSANTSIPVYLSSLFKQQHALPGDSHLWAPQIAVSSAAADLAARSTDQSITDSLDPVPNPITFLCSGYALALVSIALLVNRIQNVVPPRRRNVRLEPLIRVGLRLPALLLLVRSIALTLAKAFYGAGIDQSSRFYTIGTSVLSTEYGGRPDAQILWSVFISLGIACLSEAFVQALNNNIRPHPSVNLLSVSYLLHFHSTPASSPLLRPTPIVYILIALTLAEVLSLQIMDTFHFNFRLIITGLFSICGQSAMILLLYRAAQSDSDPNAFAAALPALRHLTRLSELIFFAIALTTVALHALSQLFTEGRITSEIFGSTTRMPDLSDDFSIAVIIYGTACLENTHLTGLNNEVTEMQAALEPYVELGRGSPNVHQPADLRSRSIPQRIGFDNEIKDIRTTTRFAKDQSDPLSRSASVHNAGFRMCWIFVKIWFNRFRKVVHKSTQSSSILRRAASGTGRASRLLRFFGFARNLTQAEKDSRRAFDNAQWLLLTQDLMDARTDGDDPDYQPVADEDKSSSSDESDLESPPMTPSLAQDGALDLYQDMLQPSTQLVPTRPHDINEVLLAHLTSGDAVTRSRYRQLAFSTGLRPVASGSGVPDLDPARMEQLETQLICVVCRSDVRRIICWPCRCLALCETCKDSLAVIPSTQSLCPTCRKPVTGFSRIFIP